MGRQKKERTYERYDKKAKTCLFFNYDLTTKVDFL